MAESSTQTKPANPANQSDQAKPGGSPAFVTDAEKKAQADKAKIAGSPITNKDESQGRYNSSKS